MSPIKREVIIGDARLLLSAIYSIKHSASGKTYIGSAVNFRRRWNQHKSDLALGRHKSPKLQASWNKHGPNAFVFDVVEYVPLASNLIAREQFWMDSLGVVINGFNCQPAATSRLGMKHSAASKLKMSKIQSSRPRLPCSEATKKRISDALTGKKAPPCSDEYRKNMSIAMKGKKKPPRTAEHNAAAAAIRTGTKATSETKAKMTASQKARWATRKEASNDI